jgi:LysM repeat protein
MSSRLPYTFLGRKRRNTTTYIFGGLAALLFLGGLLITGRWVSAGGLGAIPIFASDTPTPTITLTPSMTPTITLTPSETPTETPVPTATASKPFLYTVQADDTLSSIAEQFQVEFIIVMILNGLNNDSVLQVGETLVIPNPDMGIPEPTAIPEGLPRGFEIDYLVLPGDTLALIAAEFASTEDAIIEANELDNPNQIFVGQLLKVPIRLVTPTPGPSPTSPASPTPGE